MPLPRVFAPLLLMGLLPLTLFASPPSPSPAHGTAFPGGLLDSSGRAAFLPAATGGIDAVDLVTGELLWHTIEAEVPLLVVADRLYAQAGLKRNRLRVLAFDLTRKGECVLESDPVVLPKWVVTSDAPGKSFQGRWRKDKDQLVLDWEAKAWAPRAQRPTPEQERTARQQAAGTARIDLLTGQVVLGPREAVASLPPRRLPRQLEKLTVRWHGTVGRNFLAVVLEDVAPPAKPGGTPKVEKGKAPSAALPKERPAQCLMLRSWDWLSGKAGKPRELLRVKRPIVLPSIDERFLCLRDVAPSPDEMVASEANLALDWTIVSIEKGEVVARVKHVPGTQAVAILNGRGYFLVAGPVRGSLDRATVRGARLQAVDLKADKVLWERPLAGKTVRPPQAPEAGGK